jgi:hypothetical protein
MWSLETIKAMNADAGILARAKKLKPFVLRKKEQLEKMPPFPFPNFGTKADDMDEQHERLDSLFCDTYGFGGPALSHEGLKRKLGELLDEHGKLMLAIEEQGQFQLRLGVWKERADG